MHTEQCQEVQSLHAEAWRGLRGHLDGQEALHALAVEVALHANHQAHPPLRHLARVEVAGLLEALVLVLLLFLRKCQRCVTLLAQVRAYRLGSGLLFLLLQSLPAMREAACMV